MLSGTRSSIQHEAYVYVHMAPPPLSYSCEGYVHILATVGSYNTSQEVSEGDGVGDTGVLVFRVDGAHQGEGEVEDISVDEVALASE